MNQFVSLSGSCTPSLLPHSHIVPTPHAYLLAPGYGILHWHRQHCHKLHRALGCRGLCRGHRHGGFYHYCGLCAAAGKVANDPSKVATVGLTRCRWHGPHWVPPWAPQQLALLGSSTATAAVCDGIQAVVGFPAHGRCPCCQPVHPTLVPSLPPSLQQWWKLQ